MLNDLLNGNLPYLPNLFTMWQLSTKQLLAIGLVSAAATYVLVLILAGVRSITVPVTFVALFLSAMITNWFFKDFHFQYMSELQETLIFTVIGHILASIILIVAFRTERVS